MASESPQTILDEELYYPTGPWMPADNDELLPPDGFLDRQLGLEPRDVEVKVIKHGLPLVISFGGSGLDPDSGEARYGMQNFLQEGQVNSISLRDQYTCWFHNGVRGVSTDVATTVTYLTGAIQILQPSRVLCAGASAGGYAAILFGTLLNADGVIALCPQTLLQRGLKCQAHGYLYLLKWTDGEGTWDFKRKQQYADLLDLPESNSRVEIVYGTDDPVDVFHSERMRKFPNVTVETVPGTHGTAIIRTRDTGMLAQLFGDVLAVPIWSDDD